VADHEGQLCASIWQCDAGPLIPATCGFSLGPMFQQCLGHRGRDVHVDGVLMCNQIEFKVTKSWYFFIQRTKKKQEKQWTN
jgi:hypothetical protein